MVVLMEMNFCNEIFVKNTTKIEFNDIDSNWAND